LNAPLSRWATISYRYFRRIVALVVGDHSVSEQSFGASNPVALPFPLLDGLVARSPRKRAAQIVIVAMAFIRSIKSGKWVQPFPRARMRLVLPGR
jgi:hypothetical protein